MPHSIALPGYNLLETHQESDDLHIRLEWTGTPACTHCGTVGESIRYGRETDRRFLDTPTQGKRVVLWLRSRRYQCQACSRTFTPDYPRMDPRRAMTARLVDYVQKETLNRGHSAVARETGLDEKTVRQVFAEYVRELEKRYIFETPRVLGIDEVYLNRTYRCVLTNLEHNTLVEILPSRRKETLLPFFRQMPDRREVEVVAMDMWSTYREAVREFLPQARIVVDKFHVVRMANEALEVVRKGLKNRLTGPQRRTLKGDRKLLLMREHELTGQQRLLVETWINAFPELAAAWQCKERFFAIWDATSPAQARMLRNQWEASIPPGQDAAWKDLRRAFVNWEEEILAYFHTSKPVTNAYTESLNRYAKDLQRDGRGLSFDVMRAKMLFASRHHIVRDKPARQSPFAKGPSLDDMMENPLSNFALGDSACQQKGKNRNYGVSLPTIEAILARGD